MTEAGHNEPGDWQIAAKRVLEDWSGSSRNPLIVASPDVDGITSAVILSHATGGKIAGFYTTTWLVLFDGVTSEQAADALWLDHDVSEPGVRCMGQHLVYLDASDVLSRREPMSFNPNCYYRQSYRESFRGSGGRRRDKYPFSTSNYLWPVLGLPTPHPGEPRTALLAHGDGAWATPIDYPDNCRIWAGLMFPHDDFIQMLVGSYIRDPRTHRAHHEVVRSLIALGVNPASSRTKNRDRIPPEWRDHAGHQSIAGRVSADLSSSGMVEYVRRFQRVHDYIAELLGMTSNCGDAPTLAIKGVVDTPYPNFIKPSLDAFMVEHEIFSHAFTTVNMMRCTTGIRLR